MIPITVPVLAASLGADPVKDLLTVPLKNETTPPLDLLEKVFLTKALLMGLKLQTKAIGTTKTPKRKMKKKRTQKTQSSRKLTCSESKKKRKLM